MRWFMLFFFVPLPLLAQHQHDDRDHHDEGLDEPPLVIETAEQLRELAEIDGDPATFTADEQMKFTILAQLLGLGAESPVPE